MQKRFSIYCFPPLYNIQFIYNLIKQCLEELKYRIIILNLGLPRCYSGKESAFSAGDVGSISGSGRSGEGNGNRLQYSCLENPMEEEPGGLQSMGL